MFCWSVSYAKKVLLTLFFSLCCLLRMRSSPGKTVFPLLTIKDARKNEQ